MTDQSIMAFAESRMSFYQQGGSLTWQIAMLGEPLDNDDQAFTLLVDDTVARNVVKDAFMAGIISARSYEHLLDSHIGQARMV